jgi:uncharacterized membrane protein
MRRTITARFAVTAAVLVTAVAGLTAGAAPASAHAQDWNIPGHDLHYPMYPTCTKHMNAFEPGYGTMTCKAEYRVNRANWKFTEINTNICPPLGKLERITLYYVLNPVQGGVTWDRVLAGFSMHW